MIRCGPRQTGPWSVTAMPWTSARRATGAPGAIATLPPADDSPFRSVTVADPRTGSESVSCHCVAFSASDAPSDASPPSRRLTTLSR